MTAWTDWRRYLPALVWAAPAMAASWGAAAWWLIDVNEDIEDGDASEFDEWLAVVLLGTPVVYLAVFVVTTFATIAGAVHDRPPPPAPPVVLTDEERRLIEARRQGRLGDHLQLADEERRHIEIRRLATGKPPGPA